MASLLCTIFILSLWSDNYPKMAKSWKENWANLSTYFKYPEAVRRLIYATNAIEGFNRQLWKVTKSKQYFLRMRAFWKCCIWPWWISPKIGRSPAGLGTAPFAAGDIFWKTVIQIISRFQPSRAGPASPAWHDRKLHYNTTKGRRPGNRSCPE